VGTGTGTGTGTGAGTGVVTAPGGRRQDAIQYNEDVQAEVHMRTEPSQDPSC
jgi:hypothetical protein